MMWRQTMATRKAAKKSSSKKSSGRKSASKSSSSRKTAAKKSAPRKSAAKKTSSKSSGRKYSPSAGKDIEREMHAMKQGKLRSGRSGKKVTNPKQAIAIGLSEARREG